MAEVLIQWKSHDGPGQLKRGDIRDIGSNTRSWGRREDKRRWVAEGRDPAVFDKYYGDYAVVRINGVTPAELRKMHRLGRRAERLSEPGDPEFDRWDADGRNDERPKIRVHKFKWRINIGELPARKRDQLRDDRFTTLTAAQFIAASEHKVKRVRFDKSNPDGEGAAR